MADYYPLVARAVGNLVQNTGQARRGVYDHLRSVLRAQLEDLGPLLSGQQIINESVSLERAIHKVEREVPRPWQVEGAQRGRSWLAPDIFNGEDLSSPAVSSVSSLA